MNVHITPGVDHNFGDELNQWMWRDLFPALFDDPDDGIRFFGSGSILAQQLPTGGLNVVLGTGSSHTEPPNVHARPGHWRVYGVRGPLTARRLGLGDRSVLTDPALLLAHHPRWQGRVSPGGEPVFVPHWRSARYGQWPAACALAGIAFVDPRGDAHAVIDRIAGARLVIAGSLHAAIVADALRVPWVPVVQSREVAPYNWADWAATLGVEYTPLLLAPSSPLEALRARWLAHSAFGHIGRFHDQARRDAGPRELAWTREQLLAELSRSMARAAQPWRRRGSVVAETLLRRAARTLPAWPARLAPSLYRRGRERAAAQLREVLAAPPRLSTDGAHRRALQRCDDAVGQLQADHRQGRLA